MISATALLARRASIEQDADLLSRVVALQGFIAYEKAFIAAELTSGKVEVSEDSARDNLYEVLVEVLLPVPGKTKEETKLTFQDAVDLRDFADDITRSMTEFFTVTINFATFRADWIVPLQDTLTSLGVTID